MTYKSALAQVGACLFVSSVLVAACESNEADGQGADAGAEGGVFCEANLCISSANIRLLNRFDLARMAASRLTVCRNEDCVTLNLEANERSNATGEREVSVALDEPARMLSIRWIEQALAVGDKYRVTFADSTPSWLSFEREAIYSPTGCGNRCRTDDGWRLEISKAITANIDIVESADGGQDAAAD